MKQLRKDKTNLVSVDNKLVNASYELGLSEKRILILMVGRINNNLVDGVEKLDPLKEYSFTVQNYAELYNLTNAKAKLEIKEAINSMMDKPVVLLSEGSGENEKFIKTHWFSYVSFCTTPDTIEIMWTPTIIPYISELKKNFTSYKLQFLATLSSAYSIRLYELCLSELNKSRKSKHLLWVDVEAYRTMLALGDSYKSVSDLLKRVIIGPAKTINSSECDITLTLTDDKGKKMYKKEAGFIKQVGIWVEVKA